MKRRYFVAMTIASVIISACVYNSRVEIPTDNTQIIHKQCNMEELLYSPTAGVTAILKPIIYKYDIVDNTADKTSTHPILTEIPEPTSIVQEEIQEDPLPLYDLSSDDLYLLAKIAMAEAEGEDTIGKALVIMVVLNRVQSDGFPNNVYDVIYQKQQFSPIANGRFDRVEPSKDCYKALDMIQFDGWNESDGALYFESNECADNWHSRNLDYLFTYGGHRFYK